MIFNTCILITVDFILKIITLFAHLSIGIAGGGRDTGWLGYTTEWTFLTGHGLVLSFFARHPRMTAPEIATASVSLKGQHAI